jgi:gluconokinase
VLVGARGSGGNSYAALAEFVEGIGRQVFGRGADQGTPPDQASDMVGSGALYERLNALAGAIPAGAGGLRCDPSFFGDRHDPGRRGAYTDVTAGTFTIGHFARATLEGTAASLAELYAAMRLAGMGDRSRVVAAGNAIRRNRLFAEILATHLGVPLTAPPYAEEAARGAAFLAAGHGGVPGSRHVPPGG